MDTSYTAIASDDIIARLQMQIDEVQHKLHSINEELLLKRSGNKLEDTLDFVHAEDLRMYWQNRKAELEDLMSFHSVRVTQISEGIGDGDQIELLNKSTGVATQYRLTSRVELYRDEKCLSLHSPLGSQIVGKRPGDMVTVQTPSGTRKYLIKTWQR